MHDSKTYNAFGSKSYDTIVRELVGLETTFVGTEHENSPEEDSVDFIAATSATLGVSSPGLSRGLSFDVSTSSVSVSEPNKGKKAEHEKEVEVLRTLKMSEVDFSNSSEDVSPDSSGARKVDVKEADLLRAMTLSEGNFSNSYICVCNLSLRSKLIPVSILNRETDKKVPGHNYRSIDRTWVC